MNDHSAYFMNGRRRFDIIEHLPEVELDTAINETQKADEARLVPRLCFVKNLYTGDILERSRQTNRRFTGQQQPLGTRLKRRRYRWTATEFRGRLAPETLR